MQITGKLVLFLAALLLQGRSAAVSAELVNENACLEINSQIPLIPWEDGDKYAGAVVYARSVGLQEGQSVLVLSELQAINGNDEVVVLSTFLAVSREAFSEEPFWIGGNSPKPISPLLGENITPEQHYGLVSRHGVYTAAESGTYHFGLVGYAASTLIEENSHLGIQTDACVMDVISLTEHPS